MSAEFLQRLLRRLYAEPAVTAAYLGGDLARSAPDAIESIDLYLAAEPGFAANLAAWLAPLGEAAFSGPEADRAGWRVVTLDGVEWRFHFAVPTGTDGLQPLYDRREGLPAAPPSPPAPSLDLATMAGRFWADLYRAAQALGKGQPLTAHSRLEECRRALVELYRLALAPREPGQGWEGLDAVPGLVLALEPMREWLVAPLDLRAQWRSAHRLAAAYESLILPLCQRLGLPYPMAMRNLAFQRLDQVRPDRGREGAPPKESPAPEPTGERSEPAVRMRVAKGRIRRS